MTRDNFNWGAENNGNVVLRAYGSIAVHENPCGDVVIRQERDAYEDEDRWVAIPVQDAELIAQAIIDKAEEIKRDWPASRPRQDQPATQQGKQQPPAPTAPTSPPPTGPGELRLEGGTRVVRSNGGAA
jgi:hypothetical protein